MFMKLDTDGNVLMTKIYPDTLHSSANDAIETSDGGYFITGIYDYGSYGVGDDFYGDDYGIYLKTDHTGYVSLDNLVNSITNNFFDYSINIYPNPMNNQATLEYNSNTGSTDYQFNLFDFKGNLVRSFVVSRASKETIIRKNGLIPGLYFYQLINGENVVSGKITVE